MDKTEDLSGIFNNLKSCLSSDCMVSISDVNECVIAKLNEAHLKILNNDRSSNVLLTIQAVLDILWEDLNTGHWSCVSENKRKVYALASLFKVIRIVQEIISDGGCTQNRLKEAIKAADMGLLLGFGYHEQLSNAAKTLNNFLNSDGISGQSVSKIISPTNDKPSDWAFKGIVGELIPVQKCPSLEYFHKHYFSPQTPVKVQDSIDHWPAIQKWKDINYLVKLARHRMVPVELGSSYTEEDWGMKLVPFEEFVNDFILKKSQSVGYLAQHQLFDQIPELKKDIYIPEYCCLSEIDDDDSRCDIDINAWFGPTGTVSPLHFDPKHNLLTQVIGRKRIILYSPEDSENLYPHESTMLHNTSQIDPHNPDYEKYPRLRSSKPYECHLYPGEMLYIPPRWWHHVQSLDTSFSVSFWWK